MLWPGAVLNALLDIRAALRVLVLLELARVSGRLPEVERTRLEQLIGEQR